MYLGFLNRIESELKGGNNNLTNNEEKGIGIAYIEGTNVNLRTAPSTSGIIIRKLNKPESYIVWECSNGWLNLGNSWVKHDPSYIGYVPHAVQQTSSEIGKLAVVRVDGLWVYNSANWDDKVRQVNKGDAFIILDVLTINGSKMYKCKYFYITAYSGYVQVKG